MAAPSGSGALRRDGAVANVLSRFGALASKLQLPLLVAACAPVAPAVVALILAVWMDWPDRALALIFGVAGLILPAWLLMRRRQLLVPLRDPLRAADDVIAAFAISSVLEQAAAQVTTLPASPRRALVQARRAWTRLNLGRQVYSRLTGLPAVAPFLPGRLRGIGILVGLSVALAVVTAAFDVVAALLLVLGTW